MIRDVGDFLRRILAEFLADRRAAIAAGFPASGRSLRFEQGAPARPVEQLARLAINFEIFELDAKVRDRCSRRVELFIGYQRVRWRTFTRLRSLSTVTIQRLASAKGSTEAADLSMAILSRANRHVRAENADNLTDDVVRRRPIREWPIVESVRLDVRPMVRHPGMTKRANDASRRRNAHSRLTPGHELSIESVVSLPTHSADRMLALDHV